MVPSLGLTAPHVEIRYLQRASGKVHMKNTRSILQTILMKKSARRIILKVVLEDGLN
jgi:hypothetical protein